MQKIDKVVALVAEFFVDEEFSREEIAGVVREAYEVADVDFGAEEAACAAEDFEWPEEVLTRDSHKAERAGFSLERMVREEHDSKAHDRLSHARINSLLGSEGQGGGRRDGRENRDWERLHRLVDGARVLVDEDFAPNNRAPPLRSLYRRVSKAVHKLLLELWKEEKVFIVTKDVAAKLGALHYSPTHWARKAGKVLGRNIFDASDGKFSTPLNTKTVKAMVRECYGDIRHPTIDEIVRMIMDFARDKQQELGEGFRWEDLRMWKADLRGAFTLLNYHADDVRLMACELTGDLVCIYHTGQFGWTGMPFAFDIITRTLRKLVRSVIRGRMTMYVDDMIAVCMAWDLEHDKGQAKAVSEGLLGSKAIADDKWADGTRLDVIGWTVDLTQRLVTIARKNFLKTLYGFFEVDLSRPVQVRTLKRLASWSSRYSMVLRHMRPFSTWLYNETKGMRNMEASKRVGSGTVRAVLMWRMMLCLLHLREDTFARPLSSFLSDRATFVIKYDGSLQGIGVSVHSLKDADGSDETMLGVGYLTFPFDLGGRPEFQNCSEFMAVVVGFLMIARRGGRDANIRLVGNSVTSLVWGESEHFNSTRCFSAAMVHVLLGVDFRLRVTETVHVLSEDNGFHDQLSRGISPRELGVDPDLCWDLDTDDVVMGVVRLCNPLITLERMEDFIGFWREAKRLLR